VVSVACSPASDNAAVAGYRVSRAGASFTTGTAGLIDNGVASGAQYTYSVQAFDRKGNLSPAATVSATVPAGTDSIAPTAPTLTAVGSDHSLRLSWSASTDNVGVAYYRISPCFVAQCLVPASTRSLTVSGLPTRTRYDLQVLAVDGDGNMSGLGYGKFTDYTAAAGTTAPSQPQLLNSPAGRYHHVELTWAPSTDDRGVAAYSVFRNNRQIATVASTSYTDTLVGTWSEYYVQAIDTDGSLSAPSTRVGFPAPSSASSDSSPPTVSASAPLTGASVSGSLGVNASASDDVAVTRLELYVDGVLKATKTVQPYAFSLDTTTLSEGSHWLFVRAYDAAGNYGASDAMTVSVANL